MTQPPITPPRESMLAWLRRSRRSLAELSRVQHWLVTRGLACASLCLGLFLVGGALLGWTQAYDLMAGLVPLAQGADPVLEWMLSIAGWFALPALIGAVAGYVIATQIEIRRSDEEKAVIKELKDRAKAGSESA